MKHNFLGLHIPIAFFTGGKESVFSILKAWEYGYTIEELIFLEKPGFSVHKLNLPAVRAVAKMLGFKLTVVEVGNKLEEDENLITYFKRKHENGVSGVSTGNVKLEQMHNIYEKLCEKTDLELIEPLERWDTLELLMEYPKIDLQFMIIGIRGEGLDPKWLGKIITQQNFEDFLSDILLRGIDPCGEYGEYHTLALGVGSKKAALNNYSLFDNGQAKYVIIQHSGNF